MWAQVGNKVHDVKIKILDTMKDLKFKKSVSGLGGADCILCVSKQADWTNPEFIYQMGFQSTDVLMPHEDTMKLWESLVDVNGDVPTKW